MNNSDDFPVLPTYQAAVEHHNSRKPYKRGKNKGLRPLGFVRRYDRSQIRMEGGGVDGAGGVVVCRYYNSDIIKFNPDNSIVLDHCHFESPSTMECMNRILYQRFKLPNIWGGSGRGSQPVSKIGGKFYLQDIKDPNIKHRFDKSLTVTPDNDIIGGGTETKYVLNQQLMGQVRKYYADSRFLEYVKYYAQMNPRVGKAEDILNAPLPALQLGNSTRYFANKAAQKRDDFFAALNDATKIQGEEDRLVAMMPLAEQLAISAADYSWDRNLSVYQYITDFKKSKEFFYELCRYQYNEALFKQEVVPKGKVLVDDNSKYIQLGSEWALPFETI